MPDAAELHQIASPGQRRHCKSISERLAVCGQVGSNPVHRLCPAQMPAETSDYLIENEYCAMRVAQRLDSLQITVDGFRRARGFHDDAGDLSRIPREQLAQA